MLEHVLAESLGTWQRGGGLTLVGPTELPGQMPDEAEEILDYDFELAARGAYTDTGGAATAQVTMLAFASPLDGLGVFARRRAEMSAQAATVRAGYLEGANLHLYAGRFYLRITPGAEGEEGAQQAHSLAAQIESRLPQTVEPPRLMRVLPRRWLRPFRANYARSELFGEGEPPRALTGEHELGDQPVRLVAVQARDSKQAREDYRRLLAHLQQEAEMVPLQALGEQAFLVQHPRYGLCVGMLQDEFVAAALGTPSPQDAEALMRLVGTRIRTTRPLPTTATP